MINKHNIRLMLMFLLTGGFYFLSFYALFQQVFVLSAMAYFLAFFIVFHFFYIEIYKYKFRYFVGIMTILTIGLSVLWGYGNLQIILSIIAMNVCIVMLGYYLNPELKNKIRFDSISYFLSGGYIFTVWISIAFGLALIGFYHTFPFTCEGLSKSSNSVIDTVAKPLQIGMNEANKIKFIAKEFFGYNVSDVMQINQQLSTTPNAGIFGTISKELVAQIKEENVSTSMGICQYLLAKVNEKFGKPEYRVSLVLLLFLLLYPFIRIVFWVMSFIAFVLFKLFYLTGLYKTKATTQEIEKLI